MRALKLLSAGSGAEEVNAKHFFVLKTYINRFIITFSVLWVHSSRFALLQQWKSQLSVSMWGLSWCCARGVWEPQPAEKPVPSLQWWTQHPTTRRTPASHPPEGSPGEMVGKGQAATVGCGWAATMLNLPARSADSTNTAVLLFMLQPVLSSCTFNFNEQILTAWYTTSSHVLL